MPAFTVSVGPASNYQKRPIDLLSDVLSNYDNSPYFTGINAMSFDPKGLTVEIDNQETYFSYLLDTLEPNTDANRPFLNTTQPTLFAITELLSYTNVEVLFNFDYVFTSFVMQTASDYADYEFQDSYEGFIFRRVYSNTQYNYIYEYDSRSRLSTFSRETIENNENEGSESTMAIKRKIDLGFTVKNGIGSVFPNTLKEVQICKPTDPEPDFAVLTAKVDALAPLVNDVFGATAHIGQTDVKILNINYPVYQAATPTGDAVRVGKVSFIANIYEVDATGLATDNPVETGGSFNGIPLHMSPIELEEALLPLLDEMYGYCNNGTTKRFKGIAWLGNVRPITKK